VTSTTDIHGSRSHWQFLFHRRRRSLNKTTREIFAGQLVSLSGSIIAGLLLEMVKSTLIGTVGIFLLLPGVFDLGGSVAGAFGAKISHASRQGRVGLKDFRRSLAYSLLVLFLASIVLGLIGAILASSLFEADFLTVATTAVLASMITGTIGLPIIGGVTLLASKKGLDPDNIIGPIETSIFDSLTIMAIFLILVLIR
jgi:mgtE-like transporter